MAKQIRQVGVLKNVLTGTELVEIQEAIGGFGSSKRATVQAIATLAAGLIPAPQVLSVQGRFGNVVLDKLDIGLGNADDTSDANKPVSIAQQAALDLKANIAGQVFTGPVDATVLTEAGIQVVTVATFNGHFDTRLAAVLSSTTQLPEGTNLYYTESRVDARIEELRTTTDELPEGANNKYFTGASLFNQIETTTGIYKAINPLTGVVTLIGGGTPAEPAVVMVNGQQGVVLLTSDGVPEGTTNKYVNTALASELSIEPIAGMTASNVQEGLEEIVGSAPTNRNVVTTVASSGGVTTLDLALGDYFKTTLTENTTIALLNAPSAGSFSLRITQHATTARAVAFPASMLKQGGGDFAVTAVPGARDRIIFTTDDAGASYDTDMGRGYA